MQGPLTTGAKATPLVLANALVDRFGEVRPGPAAIPEAVEPTPEPPMDPEERRCATNPAAAGSMGLIGLLLIRGRRR